MLLRSYYSKRPFYGVFIAIAIIAFGVYWADKYIPDRYLPYTPLAINDAPTFITNYKIASLKASDTYCFSVLNKSDLAFERMEDRKTGSTCGFYGAAMLKKSQVSWGGDITLKCPALAGLAIWERHDLQPIANDVFEQDVVRVRHFGTYSCRAIAGTSTPSEHSYANAIDISGFRLRDGTEISVLRHWNDGTKKGEFLKKVHQSACGRFATVLGPNYNAQHKDHFHFDQGPYVTCR